MSMFRYEKTLLSQQAAAINVDQIGTPLQIIPSARDKVTEPAQGFYAWFRVTQTGGVTSPTTDVKLQTSQDKVNWVDAVAATQLTANGGLTELKAIPALTKWVRAVSVLAGATKPDHTVQVVLLSNAHFETSTK